MVTTNPDVVDFSSIWGLEKENQTINKKFDSLGVLAKLWELDIMEQFGTDSGTDGFKF